MVKITFLGTGGAFSSGRRTNLALLIEGPDFRMLAESGPMIMNQLHAAGLKAADVDRLFTTHPHGDHVLGFPMLALNRAGTERPLHIYAGETTIGTLRILSALSFSSLISSQAERQWHALSEEGTDEVLWAEGVRLRTAVPDHPPGTPTLSARWDFDSGPSVTFITDTRPNKTSVELACGSDLLIHEASFSKTLQPDVNSAAYYHSTAAEAGEIARQANCRRLALIHLGPEIGEHPDVLIEEARAGTELDVIVPEDGDQVDLEVDARR